jgi:hypothetical protein
VLAPLNRAGDEIGARIENGRVRAVPGFAEAYRAFAEGGWNALAADPDHGGQGLPKALEIAVYEMMHSANMAFGLCPMLTQGAIEALSAHGTERQKTLYLPKLVSGEWTGTMNLTEPQAGSDLAASHARGARRQWRLSADRTKNLHHLGRSRHGGQHRPSRARAHARRAGRHQRRVAVSIRSGWSATTERSARQTISVRPASSTSSAFTARPPARWRITARMRSLSVSRTRVSRICSR